MCATTSQSQSQSSDKPEHNDNPDLARAYRSHVSMRGMVHCLCCTIMQTRCACVHVRRTANYIDFTAL